MRMYPVFIEVQNGCIVVVADATFKTDKHWPLILRWVEFANSREFISRSKVVSQLACLMLNSLLNFIK